METRVVGRLLAGAILHHINSSLKTSWGIRAVFCLRFQRFVTDAIYWVYEGTRRGCTNPLAIEDTRRIMSDPEDTLYISA